MIKALDERNIELAKILFTLKQNIDLQKIFGLNADVINEQGCGKRFFAHVQMLATESCVMSICKIFERENKQYHLNSIPAILNFIRTNKINPKYFEPIAKFISKYGSKIKNRKNYIGTLIKIYKNFYKKHQISFKRYDFARNKVFAHAEYKAQINSLPSPAVMKELLSFGVTFYYMISKAYINVGPHAIHSDKHVFSSIYRLLERLGIKDIKREFDR